MTDPLEPRAIIVTVLYIHPRLSSRRKEHRRPGNTVCSQQCSRSRERAALLLHTWPAGEQLRLCLSSYVKCDDEYAAYIIEDDSRP